MSLTLESPSRDKLPQRSSAQRSARRTNTSCQMALCVNLPRLDGIQQMGDWLC